MSLDPRRVRAAAPMPRILVVDDDRRVLELLEIALSAHGFRVITAADGEEAIQRAVGERPDLVVLDVRLPRRSGLEVCEWLRRDPEEPDVPIILVSANVETEARLQAFRRGADDYLTKPFSPKELIARVKRLLARSAEARQSRARVHELEHELSRTRDEAKRAHAETRRELRLREMAFGFGRDLQRVLDPEELGRRLVAAVTARLGTGSAWLLLPEHPGGPFVSATGRGEASALELAPDGPLGALLAGLGRPVLRRDLERFVELREALPALVTCGAAILAPLRGPDGLEGVLVIGERHDGREPTPDEAAMLDALCDVAATAAFNARRVRAQLDRALELLVADDASHAAAAASHAEAAVLVDEAAHATRMPRHDRRLLGQAVRLGARTDGGTLARLAQLALGDPTGRARALARLIERAESPATADEAVALAPDERRAVALLAVARRYAARRVAGENGADALGAVLEEAGERLDAVTRQALAGAHRARAADAPTAA